MSAEPGIERRWAKIRSDASKVTLNFHFLLYYVLFNFDCVNLILVEISSEIVIADDEHRINGWTLLSPATENKKQRYMEHRENRTTLQLKSLKKKIVNPPRSLKKR